MENSGWEDTCCYVLPSEDNPEVLPTVTKDVLTPPKGQLFTMPEFFKQENMLL